MIEFLEQLLRDAGQMAKSMQLSDPKVSQKSDLSFVTEADIAVERLIREAVSSQFPSHLFLGEESFEDTAKASLLAEVAAKDTYVWIVDPIDGTANYSQKMDYYCVSVAVCKVDARGMLDPCFAGVYAPLKDWLFLAEKGKGLKISGLSDLSKSRSAPVSLERSLLITGFYNRSGPGFEEDMIKFKKIAAQCGCIRRFGSAALDISLVAAGVVDIFWQRGLKVWDLAGSVLIAQEAGKHVCNYPGLSREIGTNRGYDLFGHGVIVGDRRLVDQICDLFRETVDES